MGRGGTRPYQVRPSSRATGVLSWVLARRWRGGPMRSSSSLGATGGGRAISRCCMCGGRGLRRRTSRQWRGGGGAGGGGGGWCSGGRQGNKPVLHVRGPRITAADFKAVAGQAAAGESRWVLMFRGSGAFANELVGERRQIISSESETMFKIGRAACR